MRIVTAALLSLTVSASAYADTMSFTVKGTSDPWLSGMPNGANASTVDYAPMQSPEDLTALLLLPGDVLTFFARGGVMNTPTCPPSCDGPDGAEIVPHYAGAENGISSVLAPLNSLVGIFLGGAQPDLRDAPDALDFSTGGLGVNFATLAPALQQVFFIGDGLTSDGTVQQFFAPEGATRLFLGTMDGWEWLNNTGSFLVDVTVIPELTPAPEPASLVLLGTGLVAIRRLRRRS